MAVRTGRELLHAIKQVTRANPFDDDAAEFLDDLVRAMTGITDAEQPHLSRAERDAVFFFEGMLRGCQVDLLGKAQRAKGKLSAAGQLDADGNPKLIIT